MYACLVGNRLIFRKYSRVNDRGKGDGGLIGDLLSGMALVRPMTLTCWRSG